MYFSAYACLATVLERRLSFNGSPKWTHINPISKPSNEDRQTRHASTFERKKRLYEIFFIHLLSLLNTSQTRSRSLASTVSTPKPSSLGRPSPLLPPSFIYVCKDTRRSAPNFYPSTTPPHQAIPFSHRPSIPSEFITGHFSIQTRSITYTSTRKTSKPPAT